MKKFILIICLLCVGCVDAEIKPEIDTKIDTKAEIESLVKAELTGIKAEIKTELKAEINTSLNANLNNKMDTKLNLLGGDIQGRIDKLDAKFDTQIETHTQNQGMFSGGGVYVTAVAVALIIGIFGTFIWLMRSLMKWKQIWHIASQTIEHLADEERPAEHVKSEFAKRIEAAGLHNIVNANLEKRGLKKKKV